MFFVSGLKPAPIEFNVKIFYLLSKNQALILYTQRWPPDKM